MAFVRLLRDLMRDKGLGQRVVPIVPDEARTFGMDSFFPTAKIYNPHGQQYTAVDRELFLAYKESPKGQILHTGINEAGSMAAFTAAGTSYATHGEPMIPVYVFYSMFGFQRTGDQMWAAMDQMARGFIIGATAGRTTLTGEGLQHADGHSPMLAATNPAVTIYDPAYGYEIAHIVRAGLRADVRPRLGRPERHVLPHRLQRAHAAARRTRRRRHRRHRPRPAPDPQPPGDGPKVQLLASGVSVPWALEAADVLEQDWGVSADVWSVTSWTELRRDGLAAEEHNFLHPDEERADALRDRETRATPPGRSSPPPTTSPRSPTRSASSCPARSPPSAPTATASPTPAPRPAAASTSTPPPSWSGRCRCSPPPVTSTPTGPGRPRTSTPARRQRRHHRQRRRRILSTRSGRVGAE